MKTDIFNFRRFGKYFASDLKTCWANYGLSHLTISLLVPLAIYILSVAFNLVMSSAWDGPDRGLRFFAFCFALLCMVVTMPVKCYGRITEKQYGSFWLTLPASRLEKFVSMVVTTCIIVPVCGIALYLGMDALICGLDHTCGQNIISGARDLYSNISELTGGTLTLNLVNEQVPVNDAAMVNDIIKQVSSPWLYIDDFFGISLPFLLGAVFFKNGKTVKTFLALFAFSTACSIAASPFMTSYVMDAVNNAGNVDAGIMNLLNKGIFRNLALVDTISDTLMNTALLAGIWFRIKTLKH